MNALTSQNITLNDNSLSQPIKVALVGVTMIQQSLLEFYFATHEGSANYSLVLAKDAEAYITNFDEHGSTDAWENLYAYQNKPTLVLSNRNETKDNYVFIAKPLSPDALANAADSINKLLDKKPAINNLIQNEIEVPAAPSNVIEEKVVTEENTSTPNSALNFTQTDQHTPASLDFPHFNTDEAEANLEQKDIPPVQDSTLNALDEEPDTNDIELLEVNNDTSVTTIATAEPQCIKEDEEDHLDLIDLDTLSTLEELEETDLNVEDVTALEDISFDSLQEDELLIETIETKVDDKIEENTPHLSMEEIAIPSLDELPESLTADIGIDSPTIESHQKKPEQKKEELVLKFETDDANTSEKPALDDHHAELHSESDLENLLEEITEKSSEHSDSKTNEKDNLANKTKDEKRWEILCGDREDSEYEKKSGLKIKFDPEKALIHHIKSTIDFTKDSDFWMEVKYKDLSMIVDPESKQIHSNLPTNHKKFIKICSNEINEEKIELVEVDNKHKMQIETETHLSKYSNESFLWSTSLISSQGLLPENTNPDERISIKNWLSLNKVEKFPHIMQIAAVFNQHHASLNETATWMNLPKRYVYAFYNGVVALDMIETDKDKSSKKHLISMMQTEEKSESKFKNMFFKKH